MASSNSKRASSAWAALPSELLGLVLSRLYSLADRVRVGAACRPWRSGARLQQLPPPMPWVALGDGDYLDIANDGVYKLRALMIADDAFGVGSAGHLLFLVRHDRGGCFLADPFSGAVLPLADLAFFLQEQFRDEMLSLTLSCDDLTVDKVVAHWPHGSSAEPPVVAALISYRKYKHRKIIFVCRAGANTGASRESYAAMSVEISFAEDITFFGGNLYVVTDYKHLFLVELGEGSGGNPAITNVKRVITEDWRAALRGSNSDDDDDDYGGSDDDNEGNKWCPFILDNPALLAPDEVYLVESGGQLLLIERWSNCYDDSSESTRGFVVCKADLDASPCRWTRMHSLDGRALFLGRCGSKSVAAAGAGDGNSGPRENYIYFIRDGGDESGVYDMWYDYMISRPLSTLERRRHWLPLIPTWVFSDRSASGSGRF